MKWGRETDYHGSRPYDSDEPPVGPFNLFRGWTGTIARRLRGLSATRPSSSTVLVANGKRNFTVLGERSSEGMPGNAAACPFPTKADNDHDPRDWRVLP